MALSGRVPVLTDLNANNQASPKGVIHVHDKTCGCGVKNLAKSVAKAPPAAGGSAAANLARRPPPGADAAVEQRAWTLCCNQVLFLREIAAKYGYASDGAVLRRLVDVANAEPSNRKRFIFTVPRCGRCFQHTRGGEKESATLELPVYQIQWLTAVQRRCKHPSVDKTVRILLDFYRGVVGAAAQREAAIFDTREASPS